MTRTLMIGVAASLLALTVGGAAQTALGRTDAQVSFSSQQALRGKALFDRACATCHAPAGDSTSRAFIVAVTGESFLGHWRTAGDLYTKLLATMPADSIGTLTEANALDLVAYLLQMNGFAPGKALPTERAALFEMVLNRRPERSGATTPTSMPVPAERSARYYTLEQAERGKRYFDGSCRMCHASGFPAARLRDRYRSVGELFLKVRTTMPGYAQDSLSPGTYRDLVAYLLQMGGYEAGPVPLDTDVDLMRGMLLPEPGFEPLFNGTDFSGFKFLLGHNCTPKPAGCGQVVPGSTFRVEKRTIVASGSPPGYMYTERQYRDFTLRLDYRFKPFPGMESDREFYGNTGYLLFLTEHRVWPRMLEIQGMNRNVLGIIFLGAKGRFIVDDDGRQRALNPVGQWNAIEIVAKDGQVRSSLNGTLISTVTEHEFREPGNIGFQSESSEVQWRNLRLRAEQ